MLEQILQRIESKGWYLYIVENNNQTINEIIPKGPVKQLEVDCQYMIFPQTQQPQNPAQVAEASKTLQTHGILPIMKVGWQAVAFCLIAVKSGDILIRSYKDITLSYKRLYESLETLTSTIMSSN